MSDAPDALPPELAALKAAGLDPAQLADPRYRLDHLYTITTDEGRRVPFRMNDAQRLFLDRWWYLSIILKARQLGYTTLLGLIALDQALFIPNFTVGIIAHNLDDVGKIFRRKILEPYEALPEALRAAVPTVKRTESEIVLANGSSISVGMSMRSGTLQMLHVSEFGKIAAQYPEKAREIVTGAFEAVAPGQIIVVESTAEGNGGAFHDMVTKAQQVRDSGRPLTKLDFRLQFFPWYLRPSNTLSDAEASVIPISAEWRRYFEGVERQQRVTLTDGQKAWYVVKAERMGHDDMKRENPSTEAEPFEVAVQGAILAKQMALVRRRHQIGRFPLIPGYPVNTFWDWGLNDDTVILAHQRINGVDRFSWSYANHGEGVEHYAQKLRQTGIEVWGTHYVPHDFDQRRPSLSSPVTLADMCRQAGIKPLVVVPRVVSLRYGIQQMRQVLPLCAFDDEDAAELVTALDNYRYEWDDKLAVYRDTPRHDEYSHGASAFMQFALMHEQLRRLGPTPKAPEQQQRERRKESIFDKPRRRRSHMTV